MKIRTIRLTWSLRLHFSLIDLMLADALFSHNFFFALVTNDSTAQSCRTNAHTHHIQREIKMRFICSFQPNLTNANNSEPNLITSLERMECSLISRNCE